MRLIWRFFMLVIGIAIGLSAYWGFKTITITNPDDEVWTALNRYWPAPVRQWSCKQVNDRIGAGKAKAPPGCEGMWR